MRMLISLAALVAASPLAAQTNQTAPAPVPPTAAPPAATVTAPPVTISPPPPAPVRLTPATPPTPTADQSEEPSAATGSPARRPASRRYRPRPAAVRRAAAVPAAAAVAAPAQEQPATAVPGFSDTGTPPAAVPAPVPVTVDNGTAAAPDQTVQPAGSAGDGIPWLWIAIGAAVLVAAFLLFRRATRARDAEFAPAEEPIAEPYADEPAVVPAAVVTDGATEDAAPPAEQQFAAAHPMEGEPAALDAETVIAAQAVAEADGPRAVLDITFRPTAAGTEVIEAVVDFEMDVLNNGTADAEDVRICVWMSSASPYQDEEIAQFHADPPEQSRMPVIEIVAGGTRPVSGRIGLAKPGIHIVTVRDRPLFVPIVMVNIAWTSVGGGEGRLERAFVIGTGGAGEKLGPIWLDRGPRMHSDVDARLHSERVLA